MRSTLTIILTLALASLAIAGVERRTVPAGLVVLDSPAGENVDVTWESRSPIDLDYKTFETATGEHIAVFHATAGSEYVVVSDCIYWEERKRDKTTWIITVEGEPEPEPTPPDPDPVVPDLDGFALVTWKKAVKANDPKAAQEQAEAYESLASKIAANGITTREQARTEWHNAIKALGLSSDWKEFGEWMSGEINRQGTTLDRFRNVCEEAAKGLFAVKPNSVGMFPTSSLSPELSKPEPQERVRPIQQAIRKAIPSAPVF